MTAMTAFQVNPGDRPPQQAPEATGPEGMDPEVIGIDRLRHRQRHLSVPFALRLSAKDSGEIITCRSILRHLPGKRLVCRASRVSGDDVIVKLFLAPRHAGRHSRRERAGIAALQKARIPTPALLSPTTLADGRTPLVVTRAVAGARSLADCWSDWEAPERRFRLKACIRLIARLHACGYVQRDTHPGNFLISGNDIFLIDGDAVRAMPPPAFGRRRRSLINLAHFLIQFDPDSECWAADALETYEHQRGWAVRPERTLLLKRLMRRCRHKRMRQRGAKVTRSCSDVAVHRRWRRYTACDRRWFAEAMQPLLDDPDRFIHAGQRLKDGNSATVVRVQHQGQTLVVKRYNIKNRRHLLRRCLRPSRGRTAWRNAHMLRLIGIATPSPRALIEERWGPFRARAFLICDHQAGTNLSAYWPHDGQADDQCMDALPSLSALIARLHAAQVSHGDMKATNLIVDHSRVILMDLDGLRIIRSPQRFERRFRKDCVRLLQNWQQGSPIHETLRTALENSTRGSDQAISFTAGAGAPQRTRTRRKNDHHG